MTEQELLQQEITEIKCDLEELKKDVKELTDAFRAASTLLGVVKWMAGVATGLTAFYILVTGHYK